MTKPVKLTATKDHINELGFANDGYDYSQHLRDLGTALCAHRFSFTFVVC